MAFYVQKYGGSSVADVEKIKKVAARIVKTARAGHQVLAVVSALGDTTDELVDLARQVSTVHSHREMDLLMATGEMISSALLAMAIEGLGEKAVALTAPQMGIKTDFEHTRARILEIDGERIEKEFSEGHIVVVAGFQGLTDDQDITTLGRGGSDTTAVALAAALGADECEIYTDVDGVFTTDPRIVAEAHKIDKINYEEMLELASLGAEVLQVRAVEFAWKYGLTVHVRSSFHEEEGTLILGSDHDMEEVLIRAVTCDKDQTRITVTDIPDRPGVAAEIFSILADKNINVDMIVQSTHERRSEANDISFTVTRSDFDGAIKTLKDTLEKMGSGGITTDDQVAKVSVVGTGMRNHPGVARNLFKALGDAKINIEMISTSEIKISVIVAQNEADEAVRILHRVFDL